MLPGREIISKFAHQVLGEGDDIHITESFQPTEENSSTIGNASIMEPPPLLSPVKVDTKKKNGQTRGGPTKSGEGADVSPKRRQEDGSVIHSTDEGDEENESDKKNLSRIRTVIRQLSDNRRLLPLRFRQPAAATFPIRSSLLSVAAEYQEMVEEDTREIATQANSDTAVSLRSSRNNLGNGKSLLKRQNAEVFSRPSAAHAKWEISSSLSSSDSSNSTTKTLTRGRVVSLDNVSCGGFSDITDDPSFLKAKKVDRSTTSKRFPLFIRSNSTARLGETFCIQEGDERGGEDRTTPASRVLQRPYDFRDIHTSPQTMQRATGASNRYNTRNFSGKASDVVHDVLYHSTVASATEAHNSFGEENQFFEDKVRQRIFSDSDIVFERQRQRSHEIDHEFNSSSFGSGYWFSDSASLDFEIDTNKPEATDTISMAETNARRRSLDIGFDKILASRISPPSASMVYKPRSRTRSDSFLHDLENRGGGFSGDDNVFSSLGDLQVDGSYPNYDHIARPSGIFERDSSTSAMVESDNGKQRPSPWTSSASRLSEIVKKKMNHQENMYHSDADDVKSSENIDFGDGRRSTNSRTDVGDSVEVDDRLPLQAVSNRLSSPRQQVPNRLASPRQPVSNRLSSPKAQSAAQKIAIALRPGPGPQAFPFPTTSSKTEYGTQEYYWAGDSASEDSESGGEGEVLWSLTMDSFDDIF